MTPPSMPPDALKILAIHPQAPQFCATLHAKFPRIEFIAAQDAATLPAHAQQAHGVIAMAREAADAKVGTFTQLRWIQALSSGVDGILAMRDLPSQVAISSMRGIHGPQVSEYVILHMLLLSRQYSAFQAQHALQQWHRATQALLHRKTVVIVGTGLIACTLALRCRALGMRTIGVSTQVRTIAEFDQVMPRGQISQAVAQGDFVVALVPLDDSTRSLISADVLRAFQPSAYFINVARGGVCDEDALLAALHSGALAGAALDVFATEPLPSGHPLWTAPRTMITPHIAGESDQYINQALPIMEENIAHFERGDIAKMRNLVRG